MKRTLCTLLSAISISAMAQSPVNMDFETWTTNTHKEVVGWYNNNVYTPTVYEFVTQVTGTANFGIRVETKSIGAFAIPGSLTNSAGNPEDGDGGVQYSGSGIPKQVSLSTRYNIATNDTALLMVYFKKNGVVLSRDTFRFTGSKTTFSSSLFNLKTLAVVPDSVIVSVSSDVFGMSPGSSTAGSYIELDEINIMDAVNVYPMLHGDFDTWNNTSLDIPDSWSTSGSVAKSTDKHGGNFSALLTTQSDGTGTPDIAFLSQGTFPIGSHVDTLIGYYKYNGIGADQAEVIAIVTDIAHAGAPTSYVLKLNTSATYKQFKIPLDDKGVTSDVSFIFKSSADATAAIGSKLYVDDLQLKPGQTTSVQNISNREVASVYPNPAKGIFNISTKSVADYIVTDIKGRVITTGQFKNTTVIDISNQPSGVYLLKLTTGETVQNIKLIKE